MLMHAVRWLLWPLSMVVAGLGSCMHANSVQEGFADHGMLIPVVRDGELNMSTVRIGAMHCALKQPICQV